MKLLIVEDEAIIAQDIAWVAESVLHFEVVFAETEDEALEAITCAQLAAAVLDANLQEGRAERVAAALQQSQIPFFVCSGCISQRLLPRPLNTAPLLRKPYRQDALIAHLNLLVNQDIESGKL